MNSNRSSIHSFSGGIHLTAKPHAFSGSVLTPKLARTLTPKLILSFTHTLAVHALESSQAYASAGPNSASTDSSVGNYYPSLSVGNPNAGNDNDVLLKEASEIKVQYTVWITKAWILLDWEEPSAALFWEMATMYYTLYVAARSVQVETLQDAPRRLDNDQENDDHDDGPPHRSIQRTFSQTIPPILSCGSSASMDSTENHNANTASTQTNHQGKSLQKNPSTSHHTSKNFIQNKQSAASAKELPIWLVGMFLLLHCEENAFQKNVSGEEEQRFGALMAKKKSSLDIFGSLLSPSLSISHKLHHDAWLDHAHCTSYLLRHLRKFLLLACIPHNSDALSSLAQLASSRSVHDLEYTSRQERNTKNGINKYTMDPEVLLRRHAEEHGTIGLNVYMTMDDLERLNLILQAPLGGKINDPALLISDTMPQEELAVYGGISLEIVEQELQRHLENDLMNSMNDNNSQEDRNSEVTSDFGKLSLENNHDDDNDRVKYKELSYSKIRGSTVFLHPNKPLLRNIARDGTILNGGRLHDVRISGCSDAHLYLLQAFEHATISCCIGCTIVIGSLAGLVDLVDCERCTITVASRRVLVSNCYDVTLSIFTPSPPLLCGDNRNCKFAPYNTYYDGLREDLLSTGLAAAVLSTEHAIIVDPLYGPALQCASNKWKIPIEISKLSDLLYAPQSVPRSSSPIAGASADDKALGTDDTVKISTLVPASNFEILIIPFLTATAKERHHKEEMKLGDDGTIDLNDGVKDGLGAEYCQNLADVLQLCPFRLPTEYERRVVAKADRVKNLQRAIQTELSPEQQAKLAEELNQGFRDWLVTSGNLRQILDLVRHDRRSVE